MQEVKDYYDEAPYFSAAFADSSPLRLEAIGIFLGLTPPPLKNARILELGCAYGGNILPFAIHNENAEVVGIDISTTQVNDGNEIAKKMGIKNFKLIEKDILSLKPDDIEMLGKFDYIIVHGVYSWVKDNVKNSILVLIKNLLNPNGIAYISYNVQPGWNSLSIIREYMMFVSENEKHSKDRLKKAKDELNFFNDYLKLSLQAQQDATLRDTSKLMLTQLNFLKNIIKDNKNDYYIMHEFLENFNDPIYFHKFAKKLEVIGLCYLLDTSLDDIFKSSLGVFRFDDHLDKCYQKRVQKEQMRDFLFNRSFRRSLVMHKEARNSKDDFDIEIGLNEISKLNLMVKLEKKDGKFWLKDSVLSENFSEIYEKFYTSYPNSLNLNDFSEFDTQSVMFAFLELIANERTAITTKQFKKVEFKAGKTKLKPRVKAYLEYFATTDIPVILLANELNQKVEMTKEMASLALDINDEKFSNSDEASQIVKILENNYFLE